MTLLEQVKSQPLPGHVALIMDGNGRWAAARGMPRLAGHRAGAEAAERLIRFVGNRIGLRYVTLFAFSSENWTRPREEVDFLMELLQEFIEARQTEFVEAGIRLRVAGDVSELPAALQDAVRRVVGATAAGEKLGLTVALNYGGRQDLARACKSLAEEVESGRVRAEDVDEASIADRLYTSGIPDPDLVVRTSGEYRLSNFLLWQIAYAELYFTDVCWPDFTPHELLRAIAAFQARDRRFGGSGGGAS
jgi:undecaprenyl diphosphate synthase